MVRVLIADDSALARQLLRNSLQKLGDIVVLDCVPAESCIERSVALDPDVIALSVREGEPEPALGLLDRIKLLQPRPAVVVIAPADSDQFTFRARGAATVVKTTENAGRAELQRTHLEIADAMRRAAAISAQLPPRRPSD